MKLSFWDLFWIGVVTSSSQPPPAPSARPPYYCRRCGTGLWSGDAEICPGCGVHFRRSGSRESPNHGAALPCITQRGLDLLDEPAPGKRIHKYPCPGCDAPCYGDENWCRQCKARLPKCSCCEKISLVPPDVTIDELRWIQREYERTGCQDWIRTPHGIEKAPGARIEKASNSAQLAAAPPPPPPITWFNCGNCGQQADPNDQRCKACGVRFNGLWRCDGCGTERQGPQPVLHEVWKG